MSENLQTPQTMELSSLSKKLSWITQNIHVLNQRFSLQNFVKKGRTLMW